VFVGGVRGVGVWGGGRCCGLCGDCVFDWLGVGLELFLGVVGVVCGWGGGGGWNSKIPGKRGGRSDKGGRWSRWDKKTNRTKNIGETRKSLDKFEEVVELLLRCRAARRTGERKKMGGEQGN